MRSYPMPFRLRLILILAVLLLSLPSAAGAEDEALGSVAGVGKQHFEKYCASCHGTDARGSGPAAESLKEEPPNLREIAKRRDGTFPIDELAKKIDGRGAPAAHGSSEMPIWGRRFSENIGGGALGEEAVRGELYVLLQYLKSIQE